MAPVMSVVSIMSIVSVVPIKSWKHQGVAAVLYGGCTQEEKTEKKRSGTFTESH